MTPTELAALRADAEKIVRSWKGELHADGTKNAAVRLARAFLATPPLAWSDAKPEVLGWYWRRDDINQEPCIGYYDPKNWFGTEWMRDLPGQFAGPIPLPVDLEAKERG